MFDNGLNCGRWVQVTIGNYCTGINDGAPNEPFCRNGSWVSDQYNGATLDMVVADSCDDGNAWCKDDPYHVDLAQASLNQFVLNGQPVGNMYPDHWNNRQVTWQFIPAPELHRRHQHRRDPGRAAVLAGDRHLASAERDPRRAVLRQRRLGRRADGLRHG